MPLIKQRLCKGKSKMPYKYKTILEKLIYVGLKHKKGQEQDTVVGRYYTQSTECNK
jgi:hypothetical protein